VTFLVWVLGTGVADLDLGRALEIALIHDLAELRTGDLPRLATCYFPDGVKHSAERRALDDLLAHLPEERRRRAAEYQAGVSLEARFVKSCDRLQLLLKVYVYERSGHAALEELWQETGAFDDGGFEVVRRLHTELSARRER
jgi:putative hydrolase of HD superfamily